VLDSASSGHLIRFLELPGAVREWLKAVFRLLIKYSNVLRLNNAVQPLLDLSRDVRGILEVLSDPGETEFVLITIAEDMAVAETEDLVRSLGNLRIPCSHVVVNMLVESTDCDFCAAKSAAQLACLQRIETILPSATVVRAPLLPHSIRGLDDLREMGGIMYADGRRRQDTIS
ncbi:MAG: hypothetical protein NTU41_11265, partial [Chloroflexi bacterium]|nr:hypothetical protein [Chloroflexota bacterium]